MTLNGLQQFHLHLEFIWTPSVLTELTLFLASDLEPIISPGGQNSLVYRQTITTGKVFVPFPNIYGLKGHLVQPTKDRLTKQVTNEHAQKGMIQLRLRGLPGNYFLRSTFLQTQH